MDNGIWGKWACILFIARDLFIYISNYDGQILRRILPIRLMLLFRAEALIHIFKLARLYLTSAGVRTFSLRVPVITSSNFLLPRFPVMSQPHTDLSCSWFIAVDFITTRFHPSRAQCAN